MKLKSLISIFFLFLLTGFASAQTGTATNTRHGGSLPATCQNQIFLKDADGLYFCGNTVNVWTKLGVVVSAFGRTGVVIATTGDYTVAQVTGAAPTASPALTGVPTTPTAANGTNNTQIASTAFVLANVGGGAVSSVFGRTGAIVSATNDYSFAQLSGSASAAQMPAFSGDASTSAGATVVTVKLAHWNESTVTNAASPYTVLSTDSVISCNATGGAVVINLPAATATGRQLVIKKIDASANACTPTRAGSDLIDAATTISMTVQYSSIVIVDSASAVWSRIHTTQAGGDATGLITALTVTKLNGTSFAGTSGNLVSFGAANIPADSGVVAANVVTAASAASAAKQLCSASGASKSCTYIDFPDVKVIPAANCVNAVAGSGFSSSSTGMPAACRGGTNNLNGVLQPIPSTGGTAYLDYELPGDWDTGVKPYLSIYYASGANASGTVIWTISSACTKQDGSVTDDPSWVAESAMGTQTMAVANRMWAQNAQLAGTLTNCIAGSTMYFKIVLSGTASSAINVSKITITTPRLLTIQAD